MNEQFSEELLSAYVDGELSPQLRAAVERWVENSPDAREKLRDFQRLSRLFGDLPRTEVPGEFSTEVMHLAERRMLLPDAAAGNGHRRFRRWVFTLAAPLTVAAALLLIVTISIMDNQVKNAPRPVAGGAAARPGNVDNRDRGENGEQPNVLIAHGEPLARDADRSMGAEGGLPPPAAPATPGGMAGGGAGPTGAAKAKFALAAPAGSHSSNSPSSAEETERQLQAINDAVQELRKSGAAEKLMLVFRMSVVDQADGLVLLQKDFADNNIRIDSPEAAERKKSADDAKPAGETSNEGLYVVAEADELIAAFKIFLARQNPGVRIFVEESIELAALDAESQKQFLDRDIEQTRDVAAKASKDSREGGKAAALAGAAAGKNSKTDEGDAKAGKKSSASVAQRKGASSGPNPQTNQPSVSGGRRTEKSASVPVPTDVDSDKLAADAAPEGRQMTNNGRQMVVPVVPPAIQNRAQNNAASNSQSTRNAARSQNQQAPSASDEAKRREEKPRKQDNEKLDEPAPSLVRMLIVIEREPQPAATPAPADKKGPSGGAS